MNEERTVQKIRFSNIMARHIQAEDKNLSDDEMVRAIMKRYEAGRAAPLIDPAE